MVQATWADVASNSCWNVWSATETTVMSRMDMIAPSTTTPAMIRTPLSSLSSGRVDWSEMRVDTTQGYGLQSPALASSGPGGRGVGHGDGSGRRVRAAG